MVRLGTNPSDNNTCLDIPNNECWLIFESLNEFISGNEYEYQYMKVSIEGTPIPVMVGRGQQLATM